MADQGREADRRARRRRDVESIFSAVVHATDPHALTRDTIQAASDGIAVSGQLLQSVGNGRLVVIGFGKASVPMVAGACEAIGDRVDEAIAVTKRGFAPSPATSHGIRVLESNHPVPGEASVVAGDEVLDLAASLGPDDVALVLISGGGSALLESPAEGVTLQDIAAVTRFMLDSGATINQLNAVRRHLSRVKGGGLAQAIAPARVMNLILSDVLGNPLPVIASGPTVPPDDAGADFRPWIERLRAGGVLTSGVERVLLSAVESRFSPVDNVVASVVIADATTAARVAAEASAALGYAPVILGMDFEGEAREFAGFWSAIARHAASKPGPFTRPSCLVGAGEMTVTVRGCGRGGRNTEMSLAAALAIDGESGITVASLATDGDDGVSGATGGVVDGQSVARMRSSGIDPVAMLTSNDSAAALSAAQALLVTGPTGTNVNDLYLALVD